MPFLALLMSHIATSHLSRPSGRIFHHGADLNAELLLAVGATPDTARRDEVMPGYDAAMRARYAIRPHEGLHKGEASVRIGEIEDGLLKRLRFGCLFRIHAEMLSMGNHVCQVYYYQLF